LADDGSFDLRGCELVGSTPHAKSVIPGSRLPQEVLISKNDSAKLSFGVRGEENTNLERLPYTHFSAVDEMR